MHDPKRRARERDRGMSGQQGEGDGTAAEFCTLDINALESSAPVASEPQLAPATSMDNPWPPAPPTRRARTGGLVVCIRGGSPLGWSVGRDGGGHSPARNPAGGWGEGAEEGRAGAVSREQGLRMATGGG